MHAIVGLKEGRIITPVAAHSTIYFFAISPMTDGNNLVSL